MLGNANSFARQAIVVERQEYQAEILTLMNHARSAILALFTGRFRWMRFQLVWIRFPDPRFYKMKPLKQTEIEEAKKCLIDAAAVATRVFAGETAIPIQNGRARPVKYSLSADTAWVMG